MTFTLGPVQTKIVELLKTTRAEQVWAALIYKYEDGHCGYCAMGLIMHQVLGYEPVWYPSGRGHFGNRELLSVIGMTPEGCDRLIRFNDTDRMTFHDMALKIEKDPGSFFDRAA